jgi:hypothetical protein
MAQEGAVDVREAFLLNFIRELGSSLQLCLGPEFKGDERLRPSTQAVANVVSGDDKVFAVLVSAANDDVAVGMPGIEVIYGNPIELRSQVLLHVAHEVPDNRLEIPQSGTVLGRHNEAELMGVSFGTTKEILQIGVIAGRVVRVPRQTLTRDTIAFNVAQVRTCRAEIARSLACIAGADDDPPAAGRKEAGGCKAPGCHPTLEVRGRYVPPDPDCADAGLAHVAKDLDGRAQVSALAVADAPKFGLKAIIGHGEFP